MCSRFEHAGGSKRWRDFSDFQVFRAVAAVFRRLSMHGIFLPRRGRKSSENGWKKRVVNLYLVFEADAEH
jgi:hypothetical protein